MHYEVLHIQNLTFLPLQAAVPSGICPDSPNDKSAPGPVLFHVFETILYQTNRKPGTG